MCVYHSALRLIDSRKKSNTAFIVVVFNLKTHARKKTLKRAYVA